MGDGGGNQAFCRPYNVDAGLKLSLHGFGARIVNETIKYFSTHCYFLSYYVVLSYLMWEINGPFLCSLKDFD